VRRFLRILLNAATAVSLLLCAASLVFKLRGIWQDDYAYRGKPDGPAAVIFAGHGSLWIGVEEHWPREGAWEFASQPPSAYLTYNPAIAITSSSHFDMNSFPGISWMRASGWIARPPGGPIVATSKPPPFILAISISWWFIFVIGAILPAIRTTYRLELHRRRRSQLSRERAGLCPACGYDLRATPGRCPECGMTPAQSPAE
jgi:hypothetical protein